MICPVELAGDLSALRAARAGGVAGRAAGGAELEGGGAGVAGSRTGGARAEAGRASPAGAGAGSARDAVGGGRVASGLVSGWGLVWPERHPGRRDQRDLLRGV